MNDKLIKKLLELPGVSSNENLVGFFIKENLLNLGYKIVTDNLGSVYGFREFNSTLPTILIDAHMDEVGFIVTEITSNGFLKIEPFGGISIEILPSMLLRIYTFDLATYKLGVVLKKNGIQLQQKLKLTDLLIDIGAKNKESLTEWNIGIGSIVVFDTKVIMNRTRIMGKAIDNRIGVYIMLSIAKYISELKHSNYNYYIGSSVQEEVGLRGGKTFAYKVNPDKAFIIDVSPANDVKEDTEYSRFSSIGKIDGGTMLRHKDVLTVYNKKILNYLENILIKNNLKYQHYFSKGATNAGTIQLVRNGIPIYHFGLVARNLHSNFSICSKEDIEITIEFLKKVLMDLNV